MSKIEKLIEKLNNNPKDFKYSELCKVFQHFGYSEDTGGKTSGSGRSFIHDKGDTFFLHEPHKSDELKVYAVNQAVKHLKDRGLI